MGSGSRISPKATDLSPPRIAEWLLGFILLPADREYVLGDLADEYQRTCNQGRGLRARLRFWRHLFQSVGPSIRSRIGAWRRERLGRRSIRQLHTGEPMKALLQDLRFAIRMLRRNPLFTLVTVATLALGIGANTAIFSVVRGVLLEPLPYHDPGGIAVVQIYWEESGSGRGGAGHSVSGPELYDIRRGSTTLEGVGAYYTVAVNVTGSEGDAERVQAGVMTADVFSLLGVDAVMGRPFTSDEDQPTAQRVAVLGSDFWSRRFAGDPSIVGKDVTINGLPRTVVGVMPPDFRLPADTAPPSRHRYGSPFDLTKQTLGGEAVTTCGRWPDSSRVSRLRKSIRN